MHCESSELNLEQDQEDKKTKGPGEAGTGICSLKVLITRGPELGASPRR